MHAIAVVLVTHDSADHIVQTLDRLAPELEPGDEVVIVDSGSRDETVDLIRRAMPTALVQIAESNIGFAPAGNRGVAATSTPLVLLLNPDCVPLPGCLTALRACADDRPEWAAWQALVVLPGGERINTAGNPVHFLGFAWAGRLDVSVAEAPTELTEVASASGAALVVRRTAWEDVGGFEERYFMYGEDVDLCLRLRLRGHQIGLVPAARVEHEYEFVKGDYKWFHLERNRWWTILRDYPTPLLLAVAPALLAFELAVLPVAWRNGWFRAKVRAMTTIVRELDEILDRRRHVQATRTVTTARFAAALTSSLDSPNLSAARAVPGLARAQGAFWRIVRGALL